MKTLLIILSIFLVFAACQRDESVLPQEIDEVDGDRGDVIKKTNGSFLVWLNGSSEETRKIAEELQRVNRYDSILSFDDLAGPDKVAELVAMAADTLSDLTVVGNAADFTSGKYSPEMMQNIRHDGQGVICIAKEGTDDELKENMLKLFGVYIGKGYYRVSYPKEQVFDFYWAEDPDAVGKLCGIRRKEELLGTRGNSGGDPSELEVTNRALRVMKRIRVSNRYFIYTNDYNYHMTGYETLDPYTADIRNFKPLDNKMYDALVDREWSIDAYNLRIYAPTNGDNLLAVYNCGGSGFINRINNRRLSIQNPPMNTVVAMAWGLRNKAYSKVGIYDPKQQSLNLKLVDFAPGLPQSETSITHSQTRSVKFELGYHPELTGEYTWGKSITYQLAEMTRKVSNNQEDARMDYCWEWYPETLFQGEKAMKDDGMIDGSVMISPQWYELIYDHVGGPPVENVFCDYNNDLSFNQNMLNYLQECAITTKTIGASAGVVAVELTDGMVLQLGGAWFNSWGSSAKHPWPSPSGVFHDLTVDVNRKTTVWIDYNNW